MRGFTGLSSLASASAVVGSVLSLAALPVSASARPVAFATSTRSRCDVGEGFAGARAVAASPTQTATALGALLRRSHEEDAPGGETRRDVLSRAAAAVAIALGAEPLAALADDADSSESLASRMFNPDGSLRSGEEVEAKSRIVEAFFSSSSEAVVSVDGSKAGEGSGGGDFSAVKVSYSVPQKWSSESGERLYLDPSEGVNARAARRIAVYRLPSPAEEKTLDKATAIGVAKALGVPTVADQIGYAKSILKADVVSGRKSVRDGIKYYEFDLAVAPDSCDDTDASGKKENLGLGFCPYDSVALLGATVAEDGRMYVISVESDREQWKRASADLKRVRSSFRVEVPPMQ
mmetsp:Transcript_54168/g.162189  ORF Transcript_54168/g.162189 Transcript_54168/m.162189 type:complete len:349 (-) Transcript_54168:214-1260(-)|eukprot:CAMPEP_0113548196 /NCGR_PEP_ID=MMETSP0015_2-20120614/12763_1 /TAXON_ID=2838 /ORGANISM="Odontella" /LENGTH=348 /DNA_ID=CAMNT_0000448807 /DNA_START=76 /DNA_END=1122 /DNA_ORIENTATION=- /assembly_acc=CAM_ASM_000160